MSTCITDTGWKRLAAAVLISAKKDFDAEYKKLNYLLTLHKKGELRSHVGKHREKPSRYLLKKDGISAAKFLASHRGNKMVELYLGMVDLDLPGKLTREAKDFNTKAPVLMRIINAFVRNGENGKHV